MKMANECKQQIKLFPFQRTLCMARNILLSHLKFFTFDITSFTAVERVGFPRRLMSSQGMIRRGMNWEMAFLKKASGEALMA